MLLILWGASANLKEYHSHDRVTFLLAEVKPVSIFRRLQHHAVIRCPAHAARIKQFSRPGLKHRYATELQIEPYYSRSVYSLSKYKLINPLTV